MKYLLSILVLFSGLSFSSTYLICDEPYTFYPNKNLRFLVRMDGTEVTMFTLSSDNYQTLKYFYDDLTVTDSEYIWNGGVFGWRLDRETLMLGSKYECKVVDWSGFQIALSELTDIVNKAKAKRKI